MKNNNAAALSASSGKDYHGSNSRVSEPSHYWFPIYEGIFEHAPIIGDAVWLFMWLIARTTNDGQRRVLGGIPIPDERPAGELGCPVKTVRRWRRILVEGGYATTVRTPYGFAYAVLKNRRWENAPARDLPKRPISERESARSGQSELPQREVRVPDSGRESARSGKYKEDITGKKQGRDSRRNSASAITELLKGGVAPLPNPTPRRTKPTGRNLNLLGRCGHTDVEIGSHLLERCETIAHWFVSRVPISNPWRTLERQRQCGELVDGLMRAFEAIEYPLDLSSCLLGYEFCWHVKNAVEDASHETPRPPKWEVCERVLDRCERVWREEIGEYTDVGLPYHPNDFNKHIHRLFEREAGNGPRSGACHHGTS